MLPHVEWPEGRFRAPGWYPDSPAPYGKWLLLRRRSFHTSRRFLQLAIASINALLMLM